MSIKLAMELWFSAIEDGGGTFGRKSEQKYDGKGYVIGGFTETLLVSKNTRTITAVELIAEWLDETTSTYVGSWVDGDFVYIDGCEVRLQREEAINLGNFLNQIAIWDIEEGKEICLEQEAEGEEATG